MLKKLIKYDLIWINKLMIVYFIIAFILSIITRIMSLYTDSFIGNLLYMILRGFAISSFASCLITCAMRIWARFLNNTYKDEAYLTHTLPISKKVMYNSKIISSILSIILSLLVIISCLLIVFLDNNLLEAIKNIFATQDMVIILISLLFTVILEMIYMIYSGLLGILLGHQSNNHRTGKSILVGIILYFTVQAFLLEIVYSFGMFDANIHDLFTKMALDNTVESFKSLIILTNIIYILFTSIMYFIGMHIYCKGINVD